MLAQSCELEGSCERWRPRMIWDKVLKAELYKRDVGGLRYVIKSGREVLDLPQSKLVTVAIQKPQGI
ncbi:Hypothetical predicted protein [Octopus vulgaris]|uniref:Uncharacterized protein n=1 Tax=Octopus vulgaris TaxID=6645 RepID=A0AA36B3H2_OCTVU|nr:Hypothetical predicted protein [Octopus vulgaris]